MEAAACGLPIVATDIRGCRQVVEPGVNGLLVGVGEVSGLRAAIERIGSDRHLMESMARVSVEKARPGFDERRVVTKVMDTYRRVAGDKGLEWVIAAPAPASLSIRPARRGDVGAIAELHRRMIRTGFLSILGTRFLRVLYGAMIEAPAARVLVAESDGVVLGFVSGVADTGDFYRRFLRRKALPAAWSVFPIALRPSVLNKMWETLRYGSGAEADIPAELLAMAVAPSARGRGLGSELIARLFDWAAEGHIDQMRVVVGMDNRPAESLYRRCGFTDSQRIEIHSGEPSLELVWRR